MFFLLYCLFENFININDLNLLNGRVISPSKPKILSKKQKGWFFLQLHDSSDIKILKSFDINISSFNFINSLWLQIYLNEDQISQVSEFFFISEVLPYDKINFKQDLQLLDESRNYIFYAHETINASKYQRIYKNYYIGNDSIFNLIEIPEILSISPYQPPILLNRFSRGATQSEKFDVVFDNLLLVPDMPLYSHNVTGKGQIVTVIDSGVDARSCYFFDSENNLPVNVTNFKHRKIVRYDAFADTNDFPNGHGTHVSGIILGNANCENCAAKLFNGHAPDAKLYFVDAGYESQSLDLGAKYDFDDVLKQSHNLGSSIMSNSWGYPPRFSLTVQQMFDDIGYKNPNITFFFGSGNSKRSFDVYAPANSKNIIGVGGTNKPEADTEFSTDQNHFYVQNEKGDTQKCIFESGKNVLSALTIDPIPNFTNQTIGKSFYVLRNDDDFKNVNNVNKILLFIKRSNVSISTKNTNKFSCKLDSDTTFIDSLEDGKTASIIVKYQSESKGSTYTKAAFSSTGPSLQGLLKPDIYAPGYQIYSAKGEGSKTQAAQCSVNGGLTTKSGTSMATPAAAGAAALAAQYFSDGFYPSGSPIQNNSIAPYSPLLRAVLINCAGKFQSSSHIPDCTNGFGIIHLTNSLVFNDEDRILYYGLRVTRNLIKFNGKKIELVSNITLTSSNYPLSVSLCWLDPPTDDQHAPIFADLDLFIETPKGDVIFGNQKPNQIEEDHSTSERVIIENPEAGIYKIHIFCPEYLGQHEVLAAVVVNGPFAHLDFEKNSPDLEFTEVAINRTCSIEKTGHICQHIVSKIENESTAPNFSMISQQPKYFYTYFQNDPINITINLDSRANLFQIYISVNQVQKFGGKIIRFAKLSQTTTFEFDNNLIPKNTYIYITLYNSLTTLENVKIFQSQAITTPQISGYSTISNLDSLPLDPQDQETSKSSNTFKQYFFFVVLVTFVIYIIFCIFIYYKCKLPQEPNIFN